MVAIVPSSQSYSFSSSHVLMWELNHKEGWAINKWCFWTVLLEMTLESPLDGKMSKSVSLKGNQPWMFIRKADDEAKDPILWPRYVKSSSGKPLMLQRLRTWREGDNRRQDDWKTAPPQWTRVWASCGRSWRTGKQGVLQFMGLQRVGHDWATELQ